MPASLVTARRRFPMDNWTSRPEMLFVARCPRSGTFASVISETKDGFRVVDRGWRLAVPYIGGAIAFLIIAVAAAVWLDPIDGRASAVGGFLLGFSLLAIYAVFHGWSYESAEFSDGARMVVWTRHFGPFSTRTPLPRDGVLLTRCEIPGLHRAEARFGLALCRDHRCMILSGGRTMLEVDADVARLPSSLQSLIVPGLGQVRIKEIALW